MNITLLADIIASLVDNKKIDINGEKYWLEAYSEDDKLVLFANSDEEDESIEYTAIITDAVV